MTIVIVHAVALHLAVANLLIATVCAVGSRIWTRNILHPKKSMTFRAEDDDYDYDDYDFSQNYSYQNVEEKYFQQILDHFDLTDDRMFDQRYFERVIAVATTNDDDTTKSITFLCVGGEGPPLDISVLIDSVHCTGDMIETAKVVADLYGYNVQLLALEHRFYGKSYPFADSSDLSLLSSRQAVEDLAHFAHSIARNIPVYIFGGSYPGMLAAFARTKYPFLFGGAVSNSAPVQAKLDFHEYLDHVGRDIAECFDLVKEGHRELAASMDSVAGRRSVAQLFHFCNETALDVRRNQELFLGDGAVEFGAQEDDPSCLDTNYCNLRQKCKFLTDSTNRTAMGALADLSEVEQQGECLDIDWEGIIDYISSPNNDETRSWLWQTCTEFGFYQTCTTDSCPYSQGFHRVEQDLELCRRVYGIETDEHIIDQTNEWSDGWDVKDKRILSVVGTVDPWTELAVPTAIVVSGASHHFWTHRPKDTDSTAVRDARMLIQEYVMTWIDEDIATTENIVAVKVA